MPEVLTDLTPVSLVRSVKANLYDQFRLMRSAPVTLFLENDELVSWQTPFPVPWFNGVLSLRDASGDVDGLVTERLAFFAGRELDAVRWWLEDGVDPAGWEPYLLRAGFRPECSTPGMAMDLHVLPDEVRQPAGSARPGCGLDSDYRAAAGCAGAWLPDRHPASFRERVSRLPPPWF